MYYNYIDKSLIFNPIICIKGAKIRLYMII